MGTSTAFGGGKNSNPLIPSWLKVDGASQFNHESISQEELLSKKPDSSPEISSIERNEANSIHQVLPSDNRFSTARRNFTSFINSSGSDRAALGRAIASYVNKAAGGSRLAAKRMKSERLATSKLGSIILSIARKGNIREAIKSINLNNLVNRPISEIYVALVDVICPFSGDLDDSITRDAYIDAIGEVTEMELNDLEKPSIDTIATIMKCFISNAIKNRILNAIAIKAITLPNNIRAVQNIEGQLRDFIRGAVADEIGNNKNIFLADQMNDVIDILYERSFSVLEALARQEVEQ